MESGTDNKRRSRFATFLLLALLAGMSVLALVPAMFGGAARPVAARSNDPDALAALGACRAYADTHDFTTETVGTIKARAFGIPYSQKVTGGRVKHGAHCVEIAESRSAIAKAALRKETDAESFKVTRGGFDGKTAVYGDPTEMTREDYIAAYGMPNDGLVKYELDGAIIGAACVGDGVYKYTLDTTRAPRYCRGEIKTTVGCKSYPEYSSIELTLYTDGERPVKLEICEKFRVDKFGGTSCTAEYTEVFRFEE